MTATESLIEQQIKAYESRLKHIDELYLRARDAADKSDIDDESLSKLDEYERLKRQLAKKTESIKTLDVEDWRDETARSAGPMAIWDVLAQQLEDFIERHEEKD